MIMENCADLLPDCFRFVRGVVDSQDLSLNISREMLQHDRQLKFIAGNLEKKIKAELQKLLDNDREKYEKFFAAFGPQIKYGVLADYGAKKEALQDLLLYWSSKEGKLISLKEYAAAMPEDQKYIYYANGESRERLGQLPQMEKLRQKGYDVLFMTDEVDGFVQQIGAWLVERGVKLVVIACNTATAAGLAHAQRTFPVPVIGVVEPGARAAAHATKNRRVGVIATKATVESDAYTKAIRHLDAGITVFSTATPRFVEIAEQGLRMAEGPIEDFTSLVSTVYIRPAFQEIAREYLEPLRRCDIDTLVLGCTHFPLLKALIGGVVGRDVTLISSAQEAAHDVAHILSRRGALASEDHEPSYDFYTTGEDVEEFRSFGARVFRTDIDRVGRVAFPS